MRAFLMLGGVVVFVSPALAVDGVREINQSCAVQTGCFTGDAMGFPVSITRSGSYVLTSDLAVSDGALSALSLAGGLEDVTLDLNGFEIRGPGSGTASGIAMSSNQNVEVRNGTVSDFGGDGVGGVGSSRSRAVDLRARGNGAYGIAFQGDSNRVERCVVDGNDDGIAIGNGGLVRDNTIAENVRTGVFVSELLVGPADAATITGNQVYENGQSGIDCAADACLVTDNVVFGNAVRGIRASSGSRVTGNVVRRNASSGTSNDGGIVAGGRTTVEKNTVSSNAFNNVAVIGTGNAIVENHIVQGDNGIGFLAGASGNLYAGNLFSGNTVDVANPAGGTDGGGNQSF